MEVADLVASHDFEAISTTTSAAIAAARLQQTNLSGTGGGGGIAAAPDGHAWPQPGDRPGARRLCVTGIVESGNGRSIEAEAGLPAR